MIRKFTVTLFLVILSGFSVFLSCYGQNSHEADFKSFFDKYGVDGCFVLYNQAGNEFTRYNPALCDSAYLPASTFKIPNSIIALEEGVVKDTGEIIKWNGTEWPVEEWNRDQTLSHAIKYSVVWVYSEFARKIGIDKYKTYLHDFDYGNENPSGIPDRFWLAGLLRISANQQVDFLRRFYYYRLPVDKNTIDIVKNIIIVDKQDSCKLSGKTGGALMTDNDYIMWFVGYLEKGDNKWFYAMNFKSDNFAKTAKARYLITKDILHYLKLMD